VIPAPLRALMAIRLEMKMGKSVSSSIRSVVSLGENFFLKALRTWFARVEAGQNSDKVLNSIPELNKTAARRCLVLALERGLKGAPIDQSLSELEEDFFVSAKNSYERHLQVLPMKLLIPLLLFIMPGVMLLLVGPLLFSISKGF
jgi:hypothetical protein